MMTNQYACPECGKLKECSDVFCAFADPSEEMVLVPRKTVERLLKYLKNEPELEAALERKNTNE